MLFIIFNALFRHQLNRLTNFMLCIIITGGNHFVTTTLNLMSLFFAFCYTPGEGESSGGDGGGRRSTGRGT
jgi:hypothetical protein